MNRSDLVSVNGFRRRSLSDRMLFLCHETVVATDKFDFNLSSTNASRGWPVQNRLRIVAAPRDFALVTTREVGSDDGPSDRASPAPTMLVVTRDAYQETRTGFAQFRINTQPALRVYS